jgi:hypothetical protein
MDEERYMDKTENTVAECTKELIAVMNKYFPKNNRSYANVSIGALLAEYEYDQQGFSDFLSKSIESYYVNAMPKLMENVEIIHDYCKDHGHTKRNRGGHGSGDSYVWYTSPVRRKAPSSWGTVIRTWTSSSFWRTTLSRKLSMSVVPECLDLQNCLTLQSMLSTMIS